MTDSPSWPDGIANGWSQPLFGPRNLNRWLLGLGGGIVRQQLKLYILDEWNKNAVTVEQLPVPKGCDLNLLLGALNDSGTLKI